MVDSRKDPIDEKSFDPGALRDNPNSTNYCDTLMLFIKCCMGTGIFALPYTFKNTGNILGTVSIIVTAFLCSYCIYILILSAHRIYFYSNIPKMTYAEVAEYAFTNGPQSTKKYAKSISVLISTTIFITSFGSASVYSVIVAVNLQELLLHFADINIEIRLLLLILLLPFLLIVWIPNLKSLASVSTIANIVMLIGITMIFYYFFTKIPDFSDLETANFLALPQFLANAVFAIDTITIAMPLENNMKKPKDFLGISGVLTVGTMICLIIYWAFGLFGYVRYGEETYGSITQNLPTDEITGQIIKILVSLTIFCAFGIQLYIALDIVWSNFPNQSKHPLIVDYVVRTILCILVIAVAIAIPLIAPFMGLIGAFCFSILGIILPVFIQTVTFWEDGFGKCYWRIWEKILVLGFGLFLLIFGSFTSALDIAHTL